MDRGGYYLGEGALTYPRKLELLDPKSWRYTLFKGSIPEEPFIDRNTRLTIFGSCFAENIGRSLRGKGFSVNEEVDSIGRAAFLVRYGAGINNTQTLLEQFKYAFTYWTPEENQWVDTDGNPVPAEKYRSSLCKVFLTTKVFIFTLGLSEVWYDKMSGQAFWRTLKEEHFDSEKHDFKFLSPEDNYQNLKKICDLIKTHVPSAQIIFTVSPIPLKATFRGISCVTANVASKASLRVAVDRLLDDNIPQTYYFPSYEAVLHGSEDPFVEDGRHVKPQIISTVVDSFIEHFIVKSKQKIEKKAPQLLFVVGAGQCGMQSVEKLLSLQKQMHVLNERPLPWEIDDTLIHERLDKMLSIDSPFVVDTCYSYLQYIPTILQKVPTAKILYLHCPSAVTVPRFLQKTVGYNYWTDQRRDRQWNKGEWDYSYPKFHSHTVNKEVHVLKYVSQYAGIMERYFDWYPKNIRRGFVRAIAKESCSLGEVLDWLGYPDQDRTFEAGIWLS